MAAFDFPNSPSTNQTHTENGVTWKWNGSVWKRVESVAQKGQKGQKGEVGADNSTKGQKGEASTVKGQKGEVGADNSTKGQKGEVGADNSTKGQKGEPGSGSSNASTATIRTESDNAQHPIIFVDSNADQQQQTLKMDDDDRLTWNPSSELLVAQNVASNMMVTWSGVSPGNAGDVLTSGGNASGWSWSSPGSIGAAGDSYNRFLYTGNLTAYTPTSGSVMIRVQLIGGGGGSGAFNTTGTYEHGTFGGGGGGYSELWVRVSDIVNGAIGAGAGGTAGIYGNNQTTGKNGGNGGTSEFYTNYSSAGILLRAFGGYGSEGYGNSITNGHGIGATTTNAYQVLSGTYAYYGAPTLFPGHNGNRNINDHTINNTSVHYTSLDAGFAGDGNPYYGKGAHGRYSSANSSGNHGVAGNTGCVIITEFGDF